MWCWDHTLTGKGSGFEFQSKSMDGHTQFVDGPVHGSGITLTGQRIGFSEFHEKSMDSLIHGAVA